MCPAGSGSTGDSDLPVPDPAPPGADPYRVPRDGPRTVLAALLPLAGGQWIALGFVLPPVNGLVANARGRRVYRHNSGSWLTIAEDGTWIVGHPSGARVAFGPTPNGPHPASLNVHGRWPAAPSGAAAQVVVSLPSGARVEINAAGRATVTAPGGTEFATPLATFTGDVQVQGDVRAGSVSLRNHVHRGVNPGLGQSGPPVA